MLCCQMSRREVLRWAAIVGSTSLLPVVDPDRAYAAAARSARPAMPINTEVVTLTETSVVITWYTGTPGLTGDKLQPAPMDTELLLGTSPLRLKSVLHRTTKTPYHYAEIHGLEPGRTYYYQARSGGMPALPAANATGNPLGVATTTMEGLRGLTDVFAFTTPMPPPGRHLFTIALANDVHMGETVAGLITNQPVVGETPPGVHQVHGEPPYPEVMLAAMVRESRHRGAHSLLVAGDLTSEASPEDLHRAKHFLDEFGTYREEVFVARGNHDRSHAGSAYSSCSTSKVDPSAHDCFADVFDADRTTWFADHIHGLRVIGLDTYDKKGNGGDNGALSDEQFAWFRRELAADPDRPTLVFGHHPLTLASDVVNDEPIRFDLNLEQARAIEALYAKTPGVFFHHAAHTHRNYRSSSTTATRVVFQEVGATKEYPGGYSLLRVHEGGYAVNFYKTTSDLAREWSERTRGEYTGVGASAFYMSGSIADRNYVVRRDLSGLHHALPASAAGSTTSTTSHGSKEGAAAHRASGSLPDTGFDTADIALTAGGVALSAAAVSAAVVRHRREAGDQAP